MKTKQCFWKSFWVGYWGLLITLSGWLLLESCQLQERKAEIREDEGKELATRYCSGCHLPVDPSALDKETWTKHVLPAMALQLKLEVWQGNHYYQGPQAAIPLADWLKIVAYYEKSAPQQPLPARPPVRLDTAWGVFSLKKPQVAPAEIATTTVVAFNSATHQIYSSNSARAGLYCWNAQLQPTSLGTLPSPAVQIHFEPKSNSRALITCIGTMLAVDRPLGQLLDVNVTQKQLQNPSTLASQMVRPIQTIPGDFDRDGQADYLICSFGHLTGGLSWLKQLPNRQFERRAIREVAGATQAVTGDFNHDGWLDAMVLFSHADEGIWLFTNNRQGGFTAQNLLRFPPVNGSTSLQLADFDRDGRLDILYTAGDNSDYSKVLKPFHGVYIFLNEGDFHYKQAYFYPVNGCTKAVASDFDRDGDLDLMTIAFFADLQHNPAETAIYFEQKAPLTFAPHALPIHTEGRWICLDVADWDADGDPDVVLGNYSEGFINQKGFTPAWNLHQPLVLLENKKQPYRSTGTAGKD